MFALKRGGNYLVTVTDRRPSESIWYTEGGYTVKSGDTLSRIAKRNHMTLAQLLRRNVQITNQNVIRVGGRAIRFLVYTMSQPTRLEIFYCT